MCAIPKNKRKFRWSVIAAASAAAAALSNSSPAATKTWDGGGVDDNVNTAANWVGDMAPVLNGANNATTDDWIFTGTNRLTPNINVNPAQVLFTLTFELISSGCRRFRTSLLENDSAVMGVLHQRLFWLGLPIDDVEHLISGITGRVPCSPPRAPLQPEHR